MTEAARPRRLPRNYRLVYDVVSALDPGEHAAAGDIHAAARRLQAGLGYSTVYRALGRLAKLGLVLEVHVPGTASALYEAARPGHSHFRCNACGRVSDIDYALPPAELDRVAGANGVTVADVSVTFNGICRRCHAPAVREDEKARHGAP